MLEKSKDPGYLAFRIIQTAFVLFLLLSSAHMLINPELFPYLGKLYIAVSVTGIILAIGLVFMPWIFAYLLALLFLVTISLFPFEIAFALPFLSGFCFTLIAFALGKLSKRYMPP
jgi:hypothetical protein